MEIKTRNQGGVHVVELGGHFDSASSAAFEETMLGLDAEGAQFLVLDMAQVSYISSAGLRSLLQLAKKLGARQGALRFVALKPAVREVFEISGFCSLFSIHDSLESALGQQAGA
ncbi:STAS domain-containing protein [Desulfovibrio sp. OttesenSCG-928-C14]|nr:STAS domain-containing protein [Desulfovibrio sp. OttesenSCG-928-C14]